MARTEIFVIDQVVQDEMGGRVYLKNVWYISDTGLNLAAGVD
jgi:hypothetical protein